MMPKWMRALIRAAYWRWGHDGDPWQQRLVMHCLGKTRLESPEHTVGTVLISQLNRQHGLERVAEVSFSPNVKPEL